MNYITEKQYKKNKKDALIYLLILICITIILGIFQLIFKYSNLKMQSSSFIKKFFLPALYIFFYGIISGFLIYFGIEKFDGYFDSKLSNIEISNLISVTIVIIFCFIYSAQFKYILDNMFDFDIVIDKWLNIIGYIFSRSIVILILILILKKKKLIKNKKIIL